MYYFGTETNVHLNLQCFPILIFFSVFTVLISTGYGRAGGTGFNQRKTYSYDTRILQRGALHPAHSSTGCLKTAPGNLELHATAL